MSHVESLCSTNGSTKPRAANLSTGPAAVDVANIDPALPESDTLYLRGWCWKGFLRRSAQHVDVMNEMVKEALKAF